MVSLRIRSLRSVFDGRTTTELLLGITADLELEVDGVVIYSEPDFPIVELARSLASWCKTPHSGRQDLYFETMESEEVGLIRIVRSGALWIVGSVHESARAPEKTLVEIDAAVSAFISDTEVRCREELGIEVAHLLA